MKTDKLFMTWNCADCVKIKECLNMEYALNDDAKGKNEQTLTYVQLFSNVGTQDIIEDFFPQLPEYKTTPLLLTYEGKYISKVEEIISYLEEQGYIKDAEKADH